MHNLTLLALDTSTEACSVALLHNNEMLHIDEVAQRSHTKRILPLVDHILAQAGISLKQVDGLAFGRGPGSFTGVRVGAGIAQGLALGADLPVLPVSNLTAMAQAAYRKLGALNVLCAIDARMGEVYFSRVQGEKVRLENREFIQWHHLSDEQVIKPEQLSEQLQPLSQDWACVGTGWAAYPILQRNATEITLPSAQDMLPLALMMWHNKQYISALEIEPIYLRNEVTWKKLEGRE